MTARDGGNAGGAVHTLEPSDGLFQMKPTVLTRSCGGVGNAAPQGVTLSRLFSIKRNVQQITCNDQK